MMSYWITVLSFARFRFDVRLPLAALSHFEALISETGSDFFLGADESPGDVTQSRTHSYVHTKTPTLPLTHTGLISVSA